MKIVNAEDMIMGRMASYVAKILMAGDEVAIINSEKAIITGTPSNVLKEYKTRRAIRHQRKGPFYPKMPDRIIKRSVKGMLPSQCAEGRDALKRLKVYIGEPKALEGDKIKVKASRNPKVERFIYVGDISRELGATF